MPEPQESQAALAAMSGWGASLSEPLLPLRQHAKVEDQLARAQLADHDMVHMFLAGMLADIVLTLPEHDPWRHLSGRIGTLTIGDNPPMSTGANGAEGFPFGTWRDAVDVVPLVHSSPFDDPGLMALACEDLSPTAAAILASGAGGWRVALRFITQAWNIGPESGNDFSGVTDMVTRQSYEKGAKLHYTRGAACAAIRWAIHRRRAYLSPSDPWPSESAFRWAWRASRTASGRTWSDEDVERAIAAEAIHRPPASATSADDDLF